MFKGHLRELSKSFGNQICPEKSQGLRRTKTDIENNLSRVLNLIKSEDQRKKEDNLRKETELVGLIEDFYNQYQSLYLLYGRLTKEYMQASPRGIKRVSSLSSCSSDSECFSSDDTEFCHSEFNSRSQRERYSSFINTLEALKTPKSTETNEFEAHEVKELRAKNAELEKSVSVLHAKLKNNEEHAMSKNSDLMRRINKLELEAKSLWNNKGKLEEKIKCCRNEALNQKKEFTNEINVMQQKFESVCNRNKELEAQLENERGKVSQYLIRITNLEENLAETVSDEQSLLKEKQCFIQKIKDLESRCSKENDLEEQLRNAWCEINTLQKQKGELELQNEQSQKEYSQTIKKLTELMERKMEELAEGIRHKMEDNIRILHRRIHVAELLNNENKDCCKLTKKKYEEENKMFGERIADFEDEIRTLRAKVWKLEADVNKEAGEKMNLMKTVTQFEREVEKLEKKLKDKDDELVSLGENKKEAIRQLCFLVEFHRDRCLYLKDLMLKMRAKHKK
ncbi:COP1-interactive protein [Trifolium repens]|nr:COP1-interactive protein [Trifolium repens]